MKKNISAFDGNLFTIVTVFVDAVSASIEICRVDALYNCYCEEEKVCCENKTACCDEETLSAWAITGIVFGCIVGLVILASCAKYCCKESPLVGDVGETRNAMRVQSDQAKKPQKRRETRMTKLADKQAKERTNSLDNAEGESKAYDFINTYQDLIQRQQVETIMCEHERNMEALNNILARSKIKQQLSLEQKLAHLRARRAEIQNQQKLAKQQRRELTEKEIEQMQDKLVT